jgi:hypothetical protein
MTTPENLDPLDPRQRDVEAPVDDAYEQNIPTEPADVANDEVHRGLEVNEYDAVEQAHSVPLDDEYR